MEVYNLDESMNDQLLNVANTTRNGNNIRFNVNFACDGIRTGGGGGERRSKKIAKREIHDENASLFGDKGGMYTFSLAGRKRFAFE